MQRLGAYLAVSLVAAGCASDRNDQAPPRTAIKVAENQPVMVADTQSKGAQPAAASSRAACPLHSTKGTVGAENVDRGAAVVFATKDDVSKLRASVATLSKPAALQGANTRLDNVHRGVRVIFEARSANDVAALRRDVTDHARRLAKACGVVFTLPPPPAPVAEKPPAASEPSPSDSPSTPSADTKADKTEKPSAAKPEDAKDKDKSKDAPKADAKDKKKDGDKPPEGDKPKNGDKPKDKPKEPERPPLLPPVNPPFG
ncbi:MAG: hypothetical protein HOW73_09955 [Polyangiaceae bacterium]|nr:hypothetical protein [Polyangiaceae bacterium]